MPKYLPAGLTQNVLNKISKKSPPYHVTQDNVSAPLERLEVEQIAGHQLVRGRGGVIAVLYRTHWTSNSLAPTFCVIGPALRTSTAKPTTFTAGYALVRHSVSFPGTTVNVFWRRATLASYAWSGFAATATRCSPREPTFGTRVTMGCGGLENQHEYDGGWSIPGPSFGRTGADQASSPPGAPHYLNGGRTKFLVPPGPRSQRVPSGDPT